MIDIHTHITPNVDDSSSSIEMSLEMLRSEAAQGGSKVFLTPHSFAFETKRPEDVYAKMRKVQERAAAEGIPLQIYQGCEIYTYRNKMEQILQDLQSGKIPSMNGTRYVMAEFDVHEGDVEDAKYCLNRYLEDGWIPIIAHAERYQNVDIETARRLHEEGIPIQVNVYSVKKESYARIRDQVRGLLANRLVDFVGSDAHGVKRRPPLYTSGVEYMYRTYDRSYIDSILQGNPQSLLYS